jgi:dCMP deaminase
MTQHTKNDISKKHRTMYMRVAKAVGASGTCDRARVGSVIVKNSCIIGTGYNGGAKGDHHCDTHGHIMVNGHCHRAVHAELNAILNAARNGVSTIGATIFCTHEPCYRCCQHLINAGISVAWYDKAYGKPDKHKEELLRLTGMVLEKHVR